MLNPGQILDAKYEIIKVLGQGGMGTVYLCKNNRLENLWAIKEVNSQWKNKIDFLAEPNILKNLSHIGIIRIIDIFYEDDNLYIVEDYVEGKTLKEHVESGGLPSSASVVDISLQLCSILNYLHSFNPPIIYRDLKPSNIMIRPDNKVVLIDFGIARAYKVDQEGDTMILGSMGYIAPEQLVNVQSNAQTDIFSLGATMFFMFTGKSISLATDIMFQGNYSGQGDKSLIKVIQKASAIEPKDRYSDIKQMITELNAIVVDEEYTRTMLMNSQESTKTVLIEDKKPRKRTKLIIITAIVSITTLVIFLSLLMSNKTTDKKALEPPTVPEIAKKTEPKQVETKKTEPKKVVEKYTTINGILDLKKPIILSSDASNKKGKGKDKNKNGNLDVRFTLNPPAAIASSKLSISLTDIEIVDKDVIAILSIKNTDEPDLKLDLSKTYLVNGEDGSTEIYDPNSVRLLSITQREGNQEVKLYFKDFDFEGSSITLKTVLKASVNKAINLYVDIK
jgi:serine/threonine protein kinase